MKKTILLVDDDSELRGFLKKLISANNFKVLEAADGAEALEMVEKLLPDIVILDFGLPKVPGETVCMEIKKNHPEIIVIALTAKSLSKDVVHGLQIGADDYIAKPFDAEELMARIRARITSIAKPPDIQFKKLIFRESVALIAIRLIGMELLFAFSFFLAVVVLSFIGSYFKIQDLFSEYLMILLTLLIINIVIVFFIVLKWYFEYTELSREGLTRFSGIIHKKVKKYACNFVEIITLDQSFLGLIFNYGTLELYDPALKEQIYLTNITDPKKNSKTVEKIISKESDQSIPFVAQV